MSFGSEAECLVAKTAAIQVTLAARALSCARFGICLINQLSFQLEGDEPSTILRIHAHETITDMSIR